MSVEVPLEWGRRGVSAMGAMNTADRTFLQNTLSAVEQLVRNTAYRAQLFDKSCRPTPSIGAP